MKLFIKNMVSLSCKILLQTALEKMEIPYKTIELGEAEIEGTLSTDQNNQLNKTLSKYGLELLENPKAILIEKIKNAIIEMIRNNDELPKEKFSHYLSRKLNHNYTYLSNIFSQEQGITIEHFIIIHKIEKVKELIVYNEMSLTQIAFLMQYSSVAHLSKQFKKVTGLTPTSFKSVRNRHPLEDL